MPRHAWYPRAAVAGFLLGALATARVIARRRRRLELRGRVVLITGGSRGLGFAAARRFLEAGADVAICARDRTELDRAEAELRKVAARYTERASGQAIPRVIALRADVTDERATQQLVADTITRFGRVDVLVNCAIEIAIGPLESMNASDFQSAFRSIFFGTYNPTHAVLPHMRARRFGRIVNVTSISGKLPIPHSSTYVTGKFATTGFSAAATIELRKYGIRVSTVMPPPLRNGAWMNVAYKGNADRELSWFAGTLSLPLASANTERAARAIVDAARHGYAETMVSPLSWLQSRFYSLFPETTISLAAAADQYLLPACPPGAGEAPAVSAAEILVSTDNPKVQKVARHGQSDAARYLQPLASMINGNGRKPN